MSHANTIDIASSPELLLFAERQAEEDTEHVAAGDPSFENRSESRPPLFVTVIAQPLADDLSPCGEPLAALTRNISRHGLSIAVENWPRPAQLAVQLVVEGQPCCLLLREKWRREQSPFAVVGLRTVKQLHADTFPRFVDGSFQGSA